LKSVQIERRKQRAREEKFEIENLSASRIYSSFRVQSASRNSYVVTIRDLSAPGANGCTCPDYLVNQLGTCKHIESVFLHLREHERNDFRKASLTPPPNAYVYLNYGEVVSVEARRPRRPPPRLAQLIDSHFDYRGRFRGDPVTHFAEFEDDLGALSEVDCSALRIADEVRSYIDYEQSLRTRNLERARVLGAVKNGRLDFAPLREELYPFQMRGALFLAFSQRALLADEMGLGKTVQALAAAIYMRDRKQCSRCLIVVPASLKRQWKREIERFTSDDVTVIEGPDREQLYPRIHTFFNIISYELTIRDQDLLKEFQPDLVILDEAQRIKNWRTRTAQAVKEIPKKYAFVLTGQPIESDLEAIYSIIQFLDQRLLGPLWRYYEHYFRFDGRGRHIGYRNLGELKARISNIFMRRTKGEVHAELPDLIENSFAIDLAPEARKIYDGARQKALALLELAAVARLDIDQRRSLDDALRTMRRADSLEMDPQNPMASPKLRELRSIIQESVLVSSRKAIVFAEQQDLTRAVSKILDEMDVGHVHFHAGVPKDQQADLLLEFTTEPGCRLFVSTDLGSTGLNLQVADILINLDQPWSSSRRNQRIGRVYRIGRSEPVQIINLVHDETVEGAIPLVTGVDRALLSRYSESDPSKGPMSLDFETKNRTLRAALSELLIAPPRHLPKRRNPVKEISSELIDRSPARIRGGSHTDSSAAVCAKKPKPPWLEKVEEELGGAFLGEALVDARWFIIVDEPQVLADKVHLLVGDKAEITVVGPAQSTSEYEPAHQRSRQQLTVAQSLLRAGFYRESASRGLLSLKEFFGARGQEPGALILEALGRGQLSAEQGGALSLLLVSAQSEDTEPSRASVAYALTALTEILAVES
jgi:superfamily II DNA or RNA helicase